MMRATAATLTVALALMGMAPNLAFCQARCALAEARVAHHASPGAAHHHPPHSAKTHNPSFTLDGNSGCKSLAQVSLLRRQDALGIDRQASPAAAPQATDPAHETPLSFRFAFQYPDRHGPPLASPTPAPLRV